MSHLENNYDVIMYSERKTDACYSVPKLCGFSHIQKGTPRLTHRGCVLQRVSLGTLISDVMVVLGMKQSIVLVQF